MKIYVTNVESDKLGSLTAYVGTDLQKAKETLENLFKKRIGKYWGYISIWKNGDLLYDKSSKTLQIFESQTRKWK